jgi:hypothetical protein
MHILWPRTLRAMREVTQALFKFVVIPVICLTLLLAAALYLLGGPDLLRFALNQLTWKVCLKILGGIALLAARTLLRHVAWYRDEPPPRWWRRSIWVNVLELLFLLALVFLGLWAIPRFA